MTNSFCNVATAANPFFCLLRSARSFSVAVGSVRWRWRLSHEPFNQPGHHGKSASALIWKSVIQCVIACCRPSKSETAPPAQVEQVGRTPSRIVYPLGEGHTASKGFRGFFFPFTPRSAGSTAGGGRLGL